MTLVGAKLAHYEITAPLGKGGMGEVWRARDRKLGRKVAIKTLPQELAGDADRLARFEREARPLASLSAQRATLPSRRTAIFGSLPSTRTSCESPDRCSHGRTASKRAALPASRSPRSICRRPATWSSFRGAWAFELSPRG
jgi:serine/threonine protein kinase